MKPDRNHYDPSIFMASLCPFFTFLGQIQLGFFGEVLNKVRFAVWLIHSSAAKCQSSRWQYFPPVAGTYCTLIYMYPINLLQVVMYYSRASTYCVKSRFWLIIQEEQGDFISRNARETFLQWDMTTRNGITHMWRLLLKGISGRWRGVKCYRGALVGNWIALIHSEMLSPCWIYGNQIEQTVFG